VTPADEREFIQLWNAGTETAAIAQALGIPRGTVASRAYALVRQGKIQARPRGGELSPPESPAGEGTRTHPDQSRAEQCRRPPLESGGGQGGALEPLAPPWAPPAH
jgi:hypothetical protein